MQLNPFGAVPQGSVLGPVLFKIIVNNLDERMGCILSKFTDTRLGGIAVLMVGRKALQRDVARLNGWAEENCVRFNWSCTCGTAVLYISTGSTGVV